ncbi:MAG: YggS family pyridoxal phosphate-dependent enzyme [Candidatus Brocadiae bacterium]|nr:YggS family pyridoxal phosphate-dependent enzyme [Candidatus Brocadiia bacterium]
MGAIGGGPVRGAVESVRARIAAACARVARRPEEVTLVAVTKTVGADRLAELAACGVRDVGENRPLDALEKAPLAPPGLTWHLIGHLQTNKARRAVGLFRVIHSLDSWRLAQVLQGELERADLRMEAFVEIHSGEVGKSGLPPGELEGFLARAAGLDRLRWAGLMTMAPWSEDPEASRPVFRALRELLGRARKGAPHLGGGLSMGMSGDFEVAIEEGATHVRVGRALFPPA